MTPKNPDRMTPTIVTARSTPPVGCSSMSVRVLASFRDRLAIVEGGLQWWLY